MIFGIVSGFNYPIQIFGTDFTFNYHSRYLVKRTGITNRITGFTIIIGDSLYKFNTLEFLQGFATGAFWVNQITGETSVDHHRYWKHLQSQLTNNYGYQSGEYTF